MIRAVGPMAAEPMSLAEAEGWFAYWETVGSRADSDAMEEREAARVLRAEYKRLRALAGEEVTW